MVPHFTPDHVAQIEPIAQRVVDIGAIHHDQPARGERVEAFAGESPITDV
jgi:hypothetical protein